MKKTKLYLFALLSLFLTSSMVGQVTETFVAGTGANYLYNVDKVDWNWARMWVEEDLVTPKITHGINVFKVASMVSQPVISAKFKFHYEKITAGSLPATVEIYYKAPYTGYKASDVNYPDGCTVLGSIEITTDDMDYELIDGALTGYIQAQINNGEDAVLFIRSTTPGVKLSILGNLGFPTLEITVPAPVTYAPSASIKNINAQAKDYWGMTSKDTLAIEFSKPMDVASVESKLSIAPASVTPALIWQGDTTVLVVCDGLPEASAITVTVDAGAVAGDGTAMKAALVKEMTTFYDNVIRSQGNFWNLGGANKTNALSIANSDNGDLQNDRKSFIYLDLAGTTSETDFKGLIIKCFDHQDASSWTKMPIDPSNTDYKLYDVTYSEFGAAFDGATFDGMTKTLIDDIVMDSTYKVYTYNSDAVLDYLKANAGNQVCIAIVDETNSTVEQGLPTIWISDPSNNPVQGAPVVVYADKASGTAIESAVASQLSLFPMPIQDGILNISGVKAYAVEVFSVSGQRLMNTKVTNNTVDVSTLNTGLYFVKVNSDKGMAVKQIVVK